MFELELLSLNCPRKTCILLFMALISPARGAVAWILRFKLLMYFSRLYSFPAKIAIIRQKVRKASPALKSISFFLTSFSLLSWTLGGKRLISVSRLAAASPRAVQGETSLISSGKEIPPDTFMLPRGLIISTGALVHSVTSFSVGSLSDRYGRKLFAIIAQPITIISVVILIFCNGFFPILITYWVFVVGETISFLLSFVYASETFDKRYIGTSMAIFDSIIDLSLAAGPFLGILVFGISKQINYPFLIVMIPSVICLIFAFSLPGRTGKSV